MVAVVSQCIHGSHYAMRLTKNKNKKIPIETKSHGQPSEVTQGQFKAKLANRKLWKLKTQMFDLKIRQAGFSGKSEYPAALSLCLLSLTVGGG